MQLSCLDDRRQLAGLCRPVARPMHPFSNMSHILHVVDVMHPSFFAPSSPYPFDFPLACFCDQKLFQSISPVLMTYLWRPVLPKNGCCDSYSRKKISLSVKPHETKIDAATMDRSVTCICNIPPSIHFRGKTHI